MKNTTIKTTFFFCAFLVGIGMRVSHVHAWGFSSMWHSVEHGVDNAVKTANETAHKAAEHAKHMASVAKQATEHAAQTMTHEATRAAAVLTTLSHKAANTAAAAAKQAKNITKAALLGAGRGALAAGHALEKVAEKIGSAIVEPHATGVVGPWHTPGFFTPGIVY